MASPMRVLFIEDSEEDKLLLIRELERGGYQVNSERVDTESALRAALRKQSWDLVITDYNMPHFSAPGVLAVLKESGIDLPCIIVTGSQGEETAVATMKAGAHDFILKGNLSRLVPAVAREMKEAELRQEQKRTERAVQHLAYYDTLTDLPNRTLLQDRLQQAILAAKRDKKTLALLVMDLDRFKEINNILGHHYGDLVLQQVGPRLREVLRESDTVARLGGDEFAVLLLSIGLDGAILTAEKILRHFLTPFVVDCLSLEVGTSIGISLFPEHGDDANTLLRRADMAMYEAKQQSTGYAVYSPQHERHNSSHLILMGDLRHAIDRNELFLQYQPKIDLRNRSIIGVEALVRWQHPSRGTVPPDQFIPLSEQGGLIKPLTLWVLKAALSQCHAWHQAGLKLSVAVNLSARNLQDPQLPDQVARLLQAYDLGPGWLHLEITESVIMADPTRAMEILNQLSKMEVHLSIDDFGTGYSSLGYLKKLPVDEIKIDKSFVKEMAVEKDDAMIVRSTIDLAHNLGLKVVAEGIETQEIYDRLVALGCDAAQGYYISRPVSPADLLGWLADSPWASKKSASEDELQIT
ncbi:MAG: EAL domain-containing protein [Candidatus Manganitrophus sp.]|nr:EAL domain-containing protein [Candidatus Manganitrophus sp.]MDC4224736.1 EAL domain-containing protein [Candidatus Manganitrophus sp.]WDT70326.1 MAG: EAL domain-containing protein [Candidatus Manganitrophus sp.]WDT82446.1 MAG: EAL domain-containing protein [Candidatus Manganitrophus sp.]